MSALASHLAPHAGVLAALDASLADVARVFDDQLRSPLAPVQNLVEHVERYRGKMLRPMLVLLSGMAAAADRTAASPDQLRTLITRQHLVVAATVEMLHMATLVHDDVLDEADVRRKGLTVNKLHGNEPAVILGDYLIASAYHLCATLPEVGPSRAIGRAAVLTASGELLQLHNRGNLDLSEATYFEIIRGKTAELIATACRLGADASGADESRVLAMTEFGLAIGSAFQIQDDILDLLGDQAVVGKSLGKDIEKGKLTLPVIRYLASRAPEQRAAARERLAPLCSTGASPEHLAAFVRDVVSSGAVASAQATAASLIARAKEQLRTLPASAARDALSSLADAVLERSS